MPKIIFSSTLHFLYNTFDFISQVLEKRSGHTEAVEVTYDNTKISYKSLCDFFWETHDPTNRTYLVIICDPSPGNML